MQIGEVGVVKAGARQGTVVIIIIITNLTTLYRGADVQ